MMSENFYPHELMSYPLKCPTDIEKEISGKKISSVLVDSASLEGEHWIRSAFTNMDHLLVKMFDVSMTHNLVGVQTYENFGCNHLYLTLIKCNGNSSNIDGDMIGAISRIEFA